VIKSRVFVSHLVGRTNRRRLSRTDARSLDESRRVSKIRLKSSIFQRAPNLTAHEPPRDLVCLLRCGLANPETVIKATRKLRDNWLRRVGSFLFNFECRALFDLTYWYLNGTPKVFPRAFNQLLGPSRDDDLIDVESGIICRREGYPMLEMPLFSTRRQRSKSTTNYRSAVQLYWAAFRMSRGRTSSR
jgi:hypothetical protein